jgi:nicotinate-nucleotide adenylyltransferase
MNAIALFGGTFNPIHNGHLLIAEEVRTKYNLDKVVFIPSYQPPHKEAPDLADPAQRMIMAHLGTVNNPCYEVSPVELDRGGKSYTVDTLRHFKQVYGDGVQMYFIIGADMLMELTTWKNIDEVLRMCRFIAVNRPGYDIAKILNYRFIATDGVNLSEDLFENILTEDVARIDISSTQIRQRVKEWKSIKYLVPEPVEQYIHNQQLYL